MNDRQQAVIVVDLGNGDCGKGTMVDFLTRKEEAQTVVRFNGGSQAAHNVITPGGRHHTFAQFGSGAFVPGTRTHLSRFMMVDPLNMLAEERHLRQLGVTDAFERTSIEGDALIITPLQKAMNKLRELARGEGRHGSCGLGIGETMSDFLAHGDGVLFARDLLCPESLRRKLSFLKGCKLEELETLRSDLPSDPNTQRELEVFDDPELIDACVEVYTHFASQVRIVDGGFLGEILRQPGTVVFEGAQGVLLDEWYGFHPYTTWSTTTCENADTLLEEQGYAGKVTKLGVLRGYSTRHGPGPFVTGEAGLTATIPDVHNGMGLWQREFRVGHFDLVAARYALEVTGQVDCLAVTNLDRMVNLPEWLVCSSYDYCGEEDDLSDHFETDGRVVNRIKVRRPANLKHQECLTELLLSCTPRYHPQSPNQEEYLDVLAEEMGVSVAIVSVGPKATDKYIRSSAGPWFMEKG